MSNENVSDAELELGHRTYLVAIGRCRGRITKVKDAYRNWEESCLSLIQKEYLLDTLRGIQEEEEEALRSLLLKVYVED